MKTYLLMALIVAVALAGVLDRSSTALYAQTPSRNPDDYHAAWVQQSGFPTIEIGRCHQFTIQFRNTGRATWYRGIVNLGTDRPRDRIPGFIREDRCSGQPSGWINPNRVELREASVPPGGVGTFVFSYTVPGRHAVGVFPEYFRPVADGVTWMEDCRCYWAVRVTGSPSTDPSPPVDRQPTDRFPDTCDTEDNRNNCVSYARCRLPSLRSGLLRPDLTYYWQKAARINSQVPRVGSVAVMNVYQPWGHLAVVEYVHRDGRIQVREGNNPLGQIGTRTGWPAAMRVTGYYQP